MSTISRVNSWVYIVLGTLILFLFTGCVLFKKVSYKEAEVKEIVSVKAPALTLDEVVVPFEVTPQQLEMARKITSGAKDDIDQAKKLLAAIMDPEHFGIKWTNLTTGTAAETIESKQGNCLSIASVFVGLARGLGLHAYYSEASILPLESLTTDDFVVKSGHITAIVDTETGRAALDIGDQLGYFFFFRRLSDIEATAHFYNNIGYERIHATQLAEQKVNWEQAAESFEIATQLYPEFEGAWNNLGIAYSHLGRYDEAALCYMTALETNPEYASSYSNLGILNQLHGNIDDAIASFDKAVELEPESARVQYRLANALRQKGQLGRAAEVLEKVLAIRDDYRKACTLLDNINQRLGRSSTYSCSESEPAEELDKSYLYKKW